MTSPDDRTAFNLTLPRSDGEALSIPMAAGDSLFVVGANGSGKSSLLHRLYRDHAGRAIRISAHRQTWLSSSTVDMTARQKREQEHQMRRSDSTSESRWQGRNEGQRPSMALFNLIDAENSTAREIASAVRSGNDDRAHELAEKDPPLERINTLLHLSNLSVSVSIEAGEDIRAHRLGQQQYSMAEMSDGERNAVLIAANVLTASAGSLFLIDEPERHLHRSIITPFLGALFSTRADCTFVISTHEVSLPLDFRESKRLLLRACHFGGSEPVAWDADLLEPDHSLDEQLQRDVLGARRGILFVEGKTETSLDRPLYSLLFPSLTVIPKGGQAQVLHSVKGLRGAKNLAWVDAFGIVDRDNRSAEEVAALREDGVFALNWYSVESIYYHPELQRRVAERRAELVGGDPAAMLRTARESAIDKVRKQVDHFARKRAIESARRRAQEAIPAEIDIDSILSFPSIDVPALRDQERENLEKAIENSELATIIERYPVRESGALDAIAKGLGFQRRSDYERAVLKMLGDDEAAMTFVRLLFDPLLSDIAASGSAPP